MARPRNNANANPTGNVISTNTVQAQHSSNVIGANNIPAMRSNVITPTIARPVRNDKVRVVPIGTGGVGSVVRRDIAMRMLKSNNTLMIQEL